MALGPEEILKCAPLHDPAFVQNHDLVHVGQRGKPVGDADDRPPLLQRVNGGLDFRLCPGVERRGGFVQHQDRGIADKGPGDGDACLLTSRKHLAALPAGGIVPLGHLLDEVVGVGTPGGLLDLLAVGSLPS